MCSVTAPHRPRALSTLHVYCVQKAEFLSMFGSSAKNRARLAALLTTGYDFHTNSNSSSPRNRSAPGGRTLQHQEQPAQARRPGSHPQAAPRLVGWGTAQLKANCAAVASQVWAQGLRNKGAPSGWRDRAAGMAASGGAVKTKDSCEAEHSMRRCLRTGICRGWACGGLSERREASLGEELGDREGLPTRVKPLLPVVRPGRTTEQK